MYAFSKLSSLEFFFKILDLAIGLKGKLFDVILSLLLELVELLVVLQRGLLEILSFHMQLGFQLVDPGAIQLFQAAELMF